MTAPSGKFCSAMPTASVSAPARVMPALPDAAPARTTPTAMPSGKLCSVTARTSIADLPSFADTPSGWSSPTCRCGTTVSSSSRKPTPPRNPTSAGSHAVLPCSPAISIAGMMSDQTEAAIMTPAAKPRNAFCTRGPISPRKKNTIAAPAVVPSSGMSRTARFTMLSSPLSFFVLLYHAGRSFASALPVPPEAFGFF